MNRYGLNLIWASRFDYKPGQGLNVHSHPFHQMIYFADGRGTLNWEDRTEAYDAGTLLFVHPGRRHALTSAPDVPTMTLDVKFALADEQLIEAAGRISPLASDPGQSILRQLETVIAEGMQQQAYYAEAACLTMVRLLYWLARAGEPAGNPAWAMDSAWATDSAWVTDPARATDPDLATDSTRATDPDLATDSALATDPVRAAGPESPVPAEPLATDPQTRVPAEPREAGGFLEPGHPARRVEQFIRRHYAEDFRMDDLARHTGYSKNYLSHAFKRQYRQTVFTFLKKVRLEKSKELLAYSEYTLQQISEAVGFKSVHHFSRVFKQLEGVSPGTWARREKRGIRKDLYFP